METISRALPDEFFISMNNHRYGLKQVRYPDDLPILYQWMHAEHVIPQWQLNKSELELHIFFEKMLADDHQRLYLMTIDGQPVGYAEIYECYRDRIARYYPSEKYDLGIHILLGEQDSLGRGHFYPTLSMLVEFIFSYTPDCSKVVAEPDSEISMFHRLAKGIGYEEQKKIRLPEKTASLFFLYRNNFYQSSVYNKLISSTREEQVTT